MADFIRGMELCSRFFQEIARPILEEFYPSLRYTAGLLGYGSDVLGFDDVVSTDHMWGPRFYLFLEEDDFDLKDKIYDTFSELLPYTYLGYSVNFSEPDPEDHGVRCASFLSEGKVSPLIFINTLDRFLEEYLGRSNMDDLDYLDWLTLSEHRLLALVSGKFFLDGIGINQKLKELSFYPLQVKLYLIASSWSILAEEQAFVKRCGDCGDEIGSRIICARMVDRLMRLCFLYSDQYAPYSKWFGTAFRYLPTDKAIGECLSKALSADSVTKREEYLVHAQELVGKLHNEMRLTTELEIKAVNYFGRDIKVIFVDKLVDAIMKQLKGTSLEQLPLIGTLSQIGNFGTIADDNRYLKQSRALYQP
jgi:hypothetical protein